MTQEDKQILLKDLCARLAYRNTKCYNRNTEEDFTLSDVSDTDTDYPTFDYGYCDIEYIQPYLRPMSSMTKEEYNEYQGLYDYEECSYNQGCEFYDEWKVEINDEERLFKITDWLNSHHFDYRGLIEKGLALPAPEGMYKF